MLKSMRRTRFWQRLPSSIITSGGGAVAVVSGIRYVHVVAVLSVGGLGALSLSTYAVSSSSSLSSSSAVTAFASRIKIPSRGRGCAPHSYSSTAAAATTAMTSSAIGTGAPSFADFLRRLPTQIGEVGRDGKTGTDVCVYMGNEAGDADSIVSSLALAYVRSLRRQQKVLQIPVVSIPRADMKLRRDVTSLLQICGVDVDGLLYVDDPPVADRILGSGGDVDVSLTLTDHNRIRSDLSHLSSSVAEIMDHHEDLRCHPDVEGSARNVAFDDGHALVGSACTLVAEELLRSCRPPQPPTAAGDGSPDETEGHSSGGESSEYDYDPSVALALLGTILLDTQNMSPETKRGTERDRVAIDGLLGRTPWGLLSERGTGDMVSVSPPFPLGELPDRAALFDWLQGAKFDISFWRDMSVRDCLRIDYKLFEFQKSSELSKSKSETSTFGISSVLVPLSELVSKDGFCEGARAYMEEQRKNDGGKNFRLLAVMSLVVDGDGGDPPRRELMLLGDDRTAVESMSEHLLCGSDEAAALRLSPMEGLNGICGAGTGGGSDLVVRAFTQGNVRASRKQVAPIMSRHPPMSETTACL